MQRTFLTVAIGAALGLSTLAAQATQTAPGETSIDGKMYVDLTHIQQTNSDSGDTDKSGTGFDAKRFYFSIGHQLDPVWSLHLTTDFNYVRNDGQTQLYVKKAYVEGHFSDAAVLRIGSAGTPWIGFVEDYYGFRYVEKALVDRLGYGNSADWGVHLGGKLGANHNANYAVSVVNGAGYKHATRGKRMDVAARIGYTPFDGMVIAVGGYSGTLGKETKNMAAVHTAQRADLMVAYASESFRLGGEYFRADNWSVVLTPVSDGAAGWSLWGSAWLTDKISMFARYDRADLSRDIDPKARDTYYNLGLQYQLTKGFKLAAVYKHEKRDGSVTSPLPAHVASLDTDEIGLWGEIKF